MEITMPKLGLVVGSLILLAATCAVAQNETHNKNDNDDKSARIAPIVALDECDPITFNAALGPDFCKNVALGALGFSTTLSDLFAEAAAGTPNPNWDFEPDTLKIKTDTLKIKKGTT